MNLGKRLGLAALAVTIGPFARAGEEKALPLEQVPAEHRKIVQDLFPEAAFASANTEVEIDGTMIYEIQGRMPDADLEELVVLVGRVHLSHRVVDHRCHKALDPTGSTDFVGIERQVRSEIDAEDLASRFDVRPVDLDLHVQSPRPQDGRIDEVFSV